MSIDKIKKRIDAVEVQLKPKQKVGIIVSETEEIPDDVALEREIARMRSEGYNHIVIIEDARPPIRE